ncbi:CD209 antigen-like protein E [Anneissia japonica]|uniref:CD209 antigen-like protein E n=1 Tax=Anneissia japonica TaxID=1529436 RepID=UPI0014254DF5|nr:CD209 antigen-like protein E [Anneissia japonica]
MWILAVNYLFLPFTAVYSQGDNGTGLCPTSWTAYEGSCYTLLSGNSSWHEAKSRCEEENANLVTISSAQENIFVSAHTDDCQKIWIGLNDNRVEDTWQWLSNETFNFSAWMKDQPNNANSNQNCVELKPSTRKWNDKKCKKNNPAYCEKG